jgi:hypothetical protein
LGDVSLCGRVVLFLAPQWSVPTLVRFKEPPAKVTVPVLLVSFSHEIETVFVLESVITVAP